MLVSEQKLMAQGLIKVKRLLLLLLSTITSYRNFFQVFALITNKLLAKNYHLKGTTRAF